ncbi:MAG: hypothetical protein R2867_05900 [Caldilineaceae bacterium]
MISTGVMVCFSWLAQRWGRIFLWFALFTLLLTCKPVSAAPQPVKPAISFSSGYDLYTSTQYARQAYGSALSQVALSRHPLLQTTVGDALTPPLLTPLEPTTVELLTHTADFTLSAPVPSTAQNTIALQLAASYRFGNDGSEPVTVILKMAEQRYNGATPEFD